MGEPKILYFQMLVLKNGKGEYLRNCVFFNEKVDDRDF
jgi:hypothetical protein